MQQLCSECVILVILFTCSCSFQWRSSLQLQFSMAHMLCPIILISVFIYVLHVYKKTIADSKEGMEGVSFFNQFLFPSFVNIIDKGVHVMFYTFLPENLLCSSDVHYLTFTTNKIFVQYQCRNKLHIMQLSQHILPTLSYIRIWLYWVSRYFVTDD